MWNSNVIVSIISIKEGLLRNAIYGNIRRYEYQNEAIDKPRPGRPKALSNRDKTHILQIFNRSPFKTTRNLIEQAGLSCHEKTLIKWIRAEGF